MYLCAESCKKDASSETQTCTRVVQNNGRESRWDRVWLFSE